MLKIKDNVDLKELEKFGFYKEQESDRYIYERNRFLGLRVEHNSRIIGIFSQIDIMIEKGVLAKLFDLIQAGLVEKVE